MAHSIRFSLAPLALALCALSACAAPDRDARGLETPALAEAAPAPAAQKPEAASDAKREKPVEPPQTEAPQPEAQKIEEPRAISPVSGSPAASDYAERPDVQAFIRKLSSERGIPLDWLEAGVAVARYSPLSEKYTTPRPNANKKTTAEKNFLLYERNLVNSERIRRGAEFLEDNREIFDRVEADTGVSRYAVAAIIGVESIFGRNMGRFRVLDALMTLSFDYTRRSKYYLAELSDFLEFCWRQQIEPVAVSGSFAGAMGLGQFMPSSLKAYGKDGDGDGHIDIVGNEADGIASVANFLLVHGWARGERPLYRVSATPEIFKATGSGGIKTHTTAGALLRAGVKPLEKLPLAEDEPALLVDLPWIKASNEKGVDYYIGTSSFAAILRYNRSYFYAAAVSLLADELEREFGENAPGAQTQPLKQ
ncbi:lytic transglycosylase [Sutterella faecalis]|uniref:Lytic transglycosylase n=2 Tax=Sutterella TaxID=40544 RepID=A0AAI9WMZ1_9BURK|nr:MULTISPECIES: lytic murein transglycosylase [Sutterella]KAB7651208.1 lytic transglycosylase [Sutterella seckii]QDA55336.1 lytic transglycosylase [Sutterella faecalis]